MSEPAAGAAPERRPGLSPLRRALLEQLAEPASASELARRLGLSRQRVNYHLRELERLGLVEPAGERRRRGFVERRMRAADRGEYSSAHLLAVAARLADDVAELRERSRAAGMPVLTFTVEVEVDFATPGAVRAFAEDLAGEVRRLAARHHRPDAPGARRHRVVAGGHPVITATPEQTAAEAGNGAEP
ncbi:MAG TPA: winged helix-turn-helix domain-containing protein [Thermomonospora sp.]|nr:winged helix-turn-helix domain-containing protein [Thermomonospora sp.]